MLTINTVIHKLENLLSITTEKLSKKPLPVEDFFLYHFLSEETDNVPHDRWIYLIPVSEFLETFDSGKFQDNKLPPIVVLAAENAIEYALAENMLTHSSVLAGCITRSSLQTTITAVSDTIRQYFRQETTLLTRMLQNSSDLEILHSAETLLSRPIALLWKDSHILYMSKHVREILGLSEKQLQLPSDLSHDLLIDKDYHQTHLAEEAYYYFYESQDRYAYCRNIFFQDSYLARLILFLPYGSDHLHKGEEELFASVFTYLAQWGINYSKIFKNSLQDFLHELISDIIHGSAIEEKSIQEVLTASGWSMDDEYAVIKYRFLAEETWGANTETTYAFLITGLESKWPESCAVPYHSEIIWLINLSRSGIDIHSHEFHQKAAAFIREYICIAGVSPSFRNFSLIPEAMQAADIALRIGRTKNPHYWYYLYKDYRYGYLIDTLRKELPVPMLVHPALLLLDRYDQENGTALLTTLRAYLDHEHNMTTAADRIFIHRTTFCRRMEKIQALTDLDLKDGDVCTDLALSFRLFYE